MTRIFAGARWALLWALVVGGPSALAQEPPAAGLEAALNLDYPPLRFDPPNVRVESVGPDVPVYFLEDHSLPLVTVFARFRGGYSYFPRDWYAAATAMPGLMRFGGTQGLDPDSVDILLESLALQVSFGSGGQGVSSTLSSLTSTLEAGMTIWAEMLKRPSFDTTQIQVWRGRELESVRRRRDDPRRLAFSEFNRLMYGDHPIGWEMDGADLSPELMRPDRFRQLHGQIVCPQNLILGVAGDVEWEAARVLVEGLLADWPDCPGELPELPQPTVRHERGVFLINRPLEQATIVMAHATDVHLGDTPDYFASRIGNSILGGGGFSSRLMARVRTEEGLAYGASSLWTAPRKSEGLLGAITQTRSETAVQALRSVLDVLAGMAQQAPEVEEVELAVDRTVNGFVFNFQSAAQVVGREMLYRAQEMPGDWLDVYLRGVQGVAPEDVLAVFEEYLRPGEMTILVLGDGELLRPVLEEFGDVEVVELGAR